MLVREAESGDRVAVSASRPSLFKHEAAADPDSISSPSAVAPAVVPSHGNSSINSRTGSSSSCRKEESSRLSDLRTSPSVCVSGSHSVVTSRRQKRHQQQSNGTKRTQTGGDFQARKSATPLRLHQQTHSHCQSLFFIPWQNQRAWFLYFLLHRRLCTSFCHISFCIRYTK